MLSHIGSNILLILTVAGWIFVLNKERKVNGMTGVGQFVLLCYLFAAVMSLLCYNNDWSSMSAIKLSIFPSLYLFVMEYIAAKPALLFTRAKVQTIEAPNMATLYIISGAYIISALIMAPTMLSSINEGITTIVVQDMAGELYMDTHSSISVQDGIISNITAVIFNLLEDISILLFMYYLTIKDNKWYIILAYILAISISLLSPISKGLRTGTILNLLSLVVAFLLLKPWIPYKRLKVFRIAGFVLLGSLLGLIVVTTISRFSNSDSGVLNSQVYYAGNANLHFNQYGLDDGGIRYGDRTANYFKKWLGFDNVPMSQDSRHAKYPNLRMNDSTFYTFVGDFTIDYGPIAAFVIFLLFFSGISKITRPTDGVLKFHQLIPLYVSIQICTHGSFYLFSYSDNKNMSLLVIIVLYFIFKFTSGKYSHDIVRQ